MPKSFLVVRAVISDQSQRAAFEDWYRNEHLADAIKAFGAEKGWRFWSDSDPSVHQAIYRFADRAGAERALGSVGIKALAADFDRTWPGIPRTRETFALVDERDA